MSRLGSACAAGSSCSSLLPSILAQTLKSSSRRFPFIFAVPHPAYAPRSLFHLAALGRKNKPKIIKSPTVTLIPRLSQAERDALPYPPDALPGARDVDSPYGTVRVYEWGPEDGRKVLLIHGITTSSVAVGAMAQELVKKGCRVMAFDLWGHGYTDSCSDLDHDIRLYSTQILLAVTSSPLSWTGTSGFSLIGCSFGGGISAAFAGYFPNLVKSLALIVPSGLIRKERLASQLRMLAISNYLPDSLLEMLIMKRLKQPLFPDEIEDSGSKALSITKEAQACLRYPHVTVHQTMQWAMQNHVGFYNSFISAARYMPGTGQQELWKRLQLRKDKTLIIAGSEDPIIVAEELREDATKVLGDKLKWRVIDGAHDITITKPKEIVDEICRTWKV